MRTLTPRIVGEILFHEGLVREAYRDSAGVWTWSVGITSASGHRVGRNRDNPQSIERCLEVFLWLLTTRYLPAVFGGFVPQEHQLAAALSFHWNTGAIHRAAWLKRFLAGDPRARDSFLDWRRPPEILPRRRHERDLFFDAKWAGDGTVALYEVAKPGYRPVRPRRMEIAQTLPGLLGPPDRVRGQSPLPGGEGMGVGERGEAARPREPQSTPTPPSPCRGRAFEAPGRETDRPTWFDRLFE